MTPLLEVKNLKVAFKERKGYLPAVHGIGFALREKETLGIVGESGCGKSLTAKALVKLLLPHCVLEGEVLFNGKNLLTFSEQQMQKIRGKDIGMIFQDPMTSLNPTLKIGNQIIEGYLRHHPEVSYQEAVECAVEMLELVGIPHPRVRIEDYPHTLSGGMRQRVMIALALISRPKLLIADEPTTALDVTIQAQILDLMKKIQQKTGTSILLITHDMSVIAGFCDRVLVMYAGRIVEEASVDELFSHPKHPYTQRLLQSIPRLDMTKDQPLVAIEGTPPSLKQSFSGCSFAPRCHQIMKICAMENPPIFNVDKEHTCSCWKYDPRCNIK